MPDPAATPVPPSAAAATLDRLTPGTPAWVQAVAAPAGRADWGRQLADLGFVPGEAVQVLHRAPFGGDPMVVRVAGSTYALRRAEAACVVLRGAGTGAAP